MNATRPWQNAARDGAAELAARGWLSGRPEDFRRALLAEARWRDSPPGTMIVQAGDTESGLVGIAYGTAEVTIGAGAADLGMLHFYRAGAWMGYTPLLGAGLTVTLVARTRVLSAHVPRDAALRLLDDQPEWWRHIAALAAAEMALAIAGAADMALRDPARRVAAVLLRLGDCRFADPRDGLPVEVSITQDELARMAASTRSTVNSLLKAFEADGAIRLGYRAIMVASPGLLRARINDDA